MAQIIQLDVPFKPTQENETGKRKVIWKNDFWGLTMYEPTKRAGKDPCQNCWAKGLCDNGECARKMFPIDENV